MIAQEELTLTIYMMISLLCDAFRKILLHCKSQTELFTDLSNTDIFHVNTFPYLLYSNIRYQYISSRSCVVICLE